MAFKMKIISIRKRIVDKDIVNDVTCMRLKCCYNVAIQFLSHDVIH